jgi:hypothetical protein
LSQGTRRAFVAGQTAGRGLTRFFTRTVGGGTAKVVGTLASLAVGFAAGVHEEAQSVVEQAKPAWKSLAARLPGGSSNDPPAE